MSRKSNYFLDSEITRAFANLKDYLNKLESSDFYSDKPLKVISLLKELLESFQQNLDSIPPSNPVFRQKLLRFLNDDFVQILRYIQRSQTRYIPWSLVSGIEEFLSNLKFMPENYIILLRPQWSWNYSVLIKEDLISGLVKKFNTLNREDLDFPHNGNVHVISFPILEKNNFLLHTIIGHEIGHFIQDSYISETFINSWEQDQLSEIKNALLKNDPNYEQEALISDADRGLLVYRGMVNEIIPDYVGFKLFGPSLLFSLYFLTLSHQDVDMPDYENDFYPPLKFRIRLLYKLFLLEFKKLDFTSAKHSDGLVKLKENLEDYLRNDNDLVAYKKYPIYKIAYNLFKKNQKMIKNFCDKKILKSIYKIDLDKIDALIERLENKIPPNEYDDNYVNLQDIFLSGWIYYYNKILNPEDSLDYVRFHSTLNKLLFSAVHLTFVQKRYNDNVNAKQN